MIMPGHTPNGFSTARRISLFPLTTIGIAISIPIIASPVIRPDAKSSPLCPPPLAATAVNIRFDCRLLISQLITPPANIGADKLSGR